MIPPPLRFIRRLAGIRPRSFFLLLASSFLLLLPACKPRQTNVEAGDAAGILHRGMGPDLGTLDPQLGTTTGHYTVLSALFEGLVAEDPVDLHPVPGVASSWDISPDGLTYTFHLRPEAKWSDGSPLIARDFIDSWHRALSPALAADNASLLYVVQGAEAFNKGDLADFSRTGFSAPDDRTVRIHLEYPAADFLALLQHWIWWPVPLRVIAAHGDPYSRANDWARPGSLVGNGPFVLKEWRPGQRIVVEKSPVYWDRNQVRLAGIVFHPIDDLAAEELAFRSGQLHLTEALPVSKIDRYRADSPGLLRIDPYLGTYFYRINVTLPFLNQRLVRQALARAVDRDAIVEKITRGGQLPARAFTPPGTAGYQPPELPPCDFAAARALLAQAGYPGGRGAPPVELLYNTSENHRVIAEALQEMWRRELGLDVTLRNMENKSVLDARRLGQYQLLRSVWIGDYVDPASFLSIWLSDSGNNYTGWGNPDYDRLLYTAVRTPDPAARDRLFHQAESILLDDLPFIPIYTYTHVFLIRPEVRGWHPNLLDHHPYKYVSLQPPR